MGTAAADCPRHKPRRVAAYAVAREAAIVAAAWLRYGNGCDIVAIARIIWIITQIAVSAAAVASSALISPVTHASESGKTEIIKH